MTKTRKMVKKNGKYTVKGNSYEMLVGSRAQVWHGTAYKTSGQLTKGDLFQHRKSGRIKSRAKSSQAKKDKRLIKAGYFTRKGEFGSFMKGDQKKKKKRGKSKKRKSIR